MDEPQEHYANKPGSKNYILYNSHFYEPSRKDKYIEIEIRSMAV